MLRIRQWEKWIKPNPLWNITDFLHNNQQGFNFILYRSTWQKSRRPSYLYFLFFLSTPFVVWISMGLCLFLVCFASAFTPYFLIIVVQSVVIIIMPSHAWNNKHKYSVFRHHICCVNIVYNSEGYFKFNTMLCIYL